MTLDAWLQSREPLPPPLLAERLRTLASATDASLPLAEALTLASGAVLRTLLDEGHTARDGALELLAADALATYAFEAQAMSPEEMDARCQWAMEFFSRITDPA